MCTKKKSHDFFCFILDGHYLNLPVLDEDRNIVGLIDVLRLTYATLEQVKQNQSIYIYICRYKIKY